MLLYVLFLELTFVGGLTRIKANNTLPLAGPTDKSASTYVASTSALIQLTEAGNLFWLPYTPGNAATSQAATWSKLTVQGLSSSTSSNGTSSTGSSGSNTGSGSNGGGGSSTGSGSSGTGTNSASGAKQTGGSNGATAVNVGMGMVTFIGSLLLGALAM